MSLFAVNASPVSGSAAAAPTVDGLITHTSNLHLPFITFPTAPVLAQELWPLTQSLFQLPTISFPDHLVDGATTSTVIAAKAADASQDQAEYALRTPSATGQQPSAVSQSQPTIPVTTDTSMPAAQTGETKAGSSPRSSAVYTSPDAASPTMDASGPMPTQSTSAPVASSASENRTVAAASTGVGPSRGGGTSTGVDPFSSQPGETAAATQPAFTTSLTRSAPPVPSVFSVSGFLSNASSTRDSTTAQEMTSTPSVTPTSAVSSQLSSTYSDTSVLEAIWTSWSSSFSQTSSSGPPSSSPPPSSSASALAYTTSSSSIPPSTTSSASRPWTTPLQYSVESSPPQMTSSMPPSSSSIASNSTSYEPAKSTSSLLTKSPAPVAARVSKSMLTSSTGTRSSTTTSSTASAMRTTRTTQTTRSSHSTSETPTPIVYTSTVEAFVDGSTVVSYLVATGTEVSTLFVSQQPTATETIIEPARLMSQQKHTSSNTATKVAVGVAVPVGVVACAGVGLAMFLVARRRSRRRLEHRSSFASDETLVSNYKFSHKQNSMQAAYTMF